MRSADHVKPAVQQREGRRPDTAHTQPGPRGSPIAEPGEHLSDNHLPSGFREERLRPLDGFGRARRSRREVAPGSMRVIPLRCRRGRGAGGSRCPEEPSAASCSRSPTKDDATFLGIADPDGTWAVQELRVRGETPTLPREGCDAYRAGGPGQDCALLPGPPGFLIRPLQPLADRSSDLDSTTARRQITTAPPTQSGGLPRRRKRRGPALRR